MPFPSTFSASFALIFYLYSGVFVHKNTCPVMVKQVLIDVFLHAFHSRVPWLRGPLCPQGHKHTPLGFQQCLCVRCEGGL